MKVFQHAPYFFCFPALALFFGLALSGCKDIPPDYTKSDVILEKYNWQGELPEKRKVRLINHFGNITTRNTNQKNIEMAGIIQKVGSDAPTPEIKINDNNGVMEIEVTYQSSTIDGYGNRIGRVDLGIYIPKGISLEMVTDFGDIKAKKHQSKLIAKTQSGKIKLSTRNVVRALSYSGDINVDLLEWKKRKFVTENKKSKYEIFTREGNVKIYFRSPIDLSIHAHTGKGIRTSDSQLLQLVNPSSRERSELAFQAVLGSGQRKLSVTAPNGYVDFNISHIKSDTVNISTPQSIDVDINHLPTVKEWKPGDPVVEIEDGREVNSRDKK